MAYTEKLLAKLSKDELIEIVLESKKGLREPFKCNLQSN